MAEAALTISLMTLLLGIAGFLANARAVRREERRREDELRLLRLQFLHEESERQAQKSALITAKQEGIRPADADARLFDFTVANAGPAFARHVRFWLSSEVDGPSITGAEAEIGPLSPNEKATKSLLIPEMIWRDPPAVVFVTYGWRDALGDHVESGSTQVWFDSLS